MTNSELSGVVWRGKAALVFSPSSQALDPQSCDMCQILCTWHQVWNHLHPTYSPRRSSSDYCFLFDPSLDDKGSSPSARLFRADRISGSSTIFQAWFMW